MNAVNAADARTRWDWAESGAVSLSWATVIATKSSPINAPATPADAVKKP